MAFDSLKEVVAWIGGGLITALIAALGLRIRFHRGNEEISTDRGKDALIMRHKQREDAANVSAEKAWEQLRAEWQRRSVDAGKIAGLEEAKRFMAHDIEELTKQNNAQAEQLKECMKEIATLRYEVRRLTSRLAGFEDSGPAPLGNV